METDDGGWTVFQWRMDGSVDFYRGWNDYEEGFGSLQFEFWLGLSKLHRITQLDVAKHSQSSDKTPHNILRVDLESFDGENAFAKYSSFGIGSSALNYTLTVFGYLGNATDGMAEHNGMKFSTKDSNNDKDGSNCAVNYKGAWWFNKCYHSHLNGLYLNGPSDPNYIGIEWSSWKNKISLKSAKMMIRRK